MLVAYDLRELSGHLKRFGRHKNVSAAIERAFSVASAHQDLAQALETLELLNKLSADHKWEQEFSSHEAGLVAASLFNSAIILYARATETAPVGRLPWFGTSKLKGDQRELHATIMWIRNKELAHFGSGKPIDGVPMIEETVALLPGEGAASLSYCTSRARNRVRFAQEFQVLAAAISDLAHEAANARLDEAGAELALALAEDPSLMAKLADYPLSSRLQRTILAYRSSEVEIGTSGSTGGKTAVRQVPGH